MTLAVNHGFREDKIVQSIKLNIIAYLLQQQMFPNGVFNLIKEVMEFCILVMIKP
jgi:hypothetical protein